jgi:zinc transport system ATP-binding protein
MSSPLVEIKNMDVAYQKKLVLSNVSLSVFEHDFIGIIGPNGGGKTSLIKAILGLLKPVGGSVKHSLLSSEIGYLPQGNQVDENFPITVKEVIASGLEHGLKIEFGSKRSRQGKVEKALETVGLEALHSRPIGKLSGGEFQRTLLARAIISSPRLLVLDEPDTHVDNLFETELYALLKELNRAITILLVSHDIGIISPYIKTIACVNRNLHYHPSNEINEEQLKVYNCPIEVIAHGPVPHRVVKEHIHK